MRDFRLFKNRNRSKYNIQIILHQPRQNNLKVYLFATYFKPTLNDQHFLSCGMLRKQLLAVNASLRDATLASNKNQPK